MSAAKGTPYGEGVMTFEQIAEELGMTHNAVWTTYQRALRKLRRPPKRAKFQKLLELSREKGKYL